jgi:hypothetical protein
MVARASHAACGIRHRPGVAGSQCGGSEVRHTVDRLRNGLRKSHWINALPVSRSDPEVRKAAYPGIANGALAALLGHLHGAAHL